MRSVHAYSDKTQHYLDLEDQYGAHNYHPIPVVLKKGQGVFVWDVDDKRYYDFLSGYSAMNQGHCHPKIIASLIEQAQKLTLTSRAFHNDLLGEYAQFVTSYFGYDKVLPMNTGVEAVETAIKLCRKWAYEVKGIPANEAKIIVCEGNFHGRTTSVISFSSDPAAYTNFGPYMPGFIKIPYNDLAALSAALQQKNVVGFLVEPIQGEAGVVVPDDGYLSKAKQYCEMANALFIADEIQTGLSRTGTMLCCDHENVRPDILILGKALSGGTLPVSAVLADDEIMLTIKPGEHGSTYGGNPLAACAARTTIETILEEDLVAHSRELGGRMLAELRSWEGELPVVSDVRGRGLMIGMDLVVPGTRTLLDKKTTRWIFDTLLARGVLAMIYNPEVRINPPLVISEEQAMQALAVLKDVLSEATERARR